MSWSSALILKGGEQVVHSWNGLLTNYVVARAVERGRVRTGKKNDKKYVHKDFY